MKRLMMLVAMIAVVLLLPMKAEAANDLIVDKEGEYATYTLIEDMTVDNLEVYSKLDLQSHTLVVKGDVIAEADIYINGGTLIVEGDYIQKAGTLLTANGATMTINGDLRIQDINENGEYVASRGEFCVLNDTSVVTVGGDTYINVAQKDCFNMAGTFVAKGDFIIENAPTSSPRGFIGIQVLKMEGDSKQKLSMVKEIKVNNMVFTNPNVEIGGYLNGTLVSDATQITLDDGIFETTWLDLNGYDMTIPGTVHAYGKVDAGEGTLTVTKDYVQTSPSLQVSTGTVIIKENFRVQGIDEDGKYVCGTGMFFADKGGLFVIGKDLIIDSTTMFTVYGTIQVAGNVSKTSEGMFTPQYIVLNGISNQSITLDGKDDSISTLELMNERKYCTFPTDKCWKIIQLEGIRNTAEGFKYYEDGNWIADAHKYVEYDGATFLVANGVVATNINGIAQDPLNPQDWYFLSGGQVQEQHTGLAEYGGEWFYVEEGKLDTTMSKCVEYDGESFMFAAGRLIGEVSGLVQDPSDGVWYYLAEGRVVAEFSGLAYYDGEWFYVSNGKLDNTYKGCAMVDGAVFRVENGVIIGEGHTSENGKCTHCGKITSAHASL